MADATLLDVCHTGEHGIYGIATGCVWQHTLVDVCQLPELPPCERDIHGVTCHPMAAWQTLPY